MTVTAVPHPDEPRPAGYVPAWLMHAEEELDALAKMFEEAAEEPWQADVHKLVVEAWRELRDHRRAAA